MSAPILAFERVGYSYPGGEDAALRDVDLEIEEGELCLLAGLSGSGKSTLLRAACGLVPHFHGGSFSGRVELCGRDTRGAGPAQLGALAGALFQDPETQLVMNTVRAEISLALERRLASPAAVARAIEEVALALGVDHLLERPTRELSGGEQQRVALAATLAVRPRVVLLDEPTSQLDPVAGEELIALLRRLNEEWGVTVLLAEHRIERCLAAADRVIALRAGAVVCDRDPAAFLEWSRREEPVLQTPAARLFALAGLDEAPVSVRQARRGLHARRLEGRKNSGVTLPSATPPVLPNACPGQGAPQNHTLRMRGVWLELKRGPAILRGVELSVAPGESLALMGRNGAGKSTLLRAAAGLLAPTRGHIERAGRLALLLQNPGDYFVRERVEDELSPRALEEAGMGHLRDRHPRDLSCGERQRLALAIVSDGEAPVALALDEPTRGMDRGAKRELAAELRRRAARGQAVIVATHDPEFAAACAERAVLLADGRVIADGPASELLAGGWYFATETARILGGAGGALLPEQGAALLRAAIAPEVSV